MHIITKVIQDKEISDNELAYELHKICSQEHSSCNDNCPVYELTKGHLPNDMGRGIGCDCFKSGSMMLNFIRYFKN